MSKKQSKFNELSPEIQQAVRDFAAKHGRNWKMELRWFWHSGKDAGPLRQLRNQLGPSGLDGLTLPQ